MAAAGFQVEAFEPMQYNVEVFSLSIQENSFQNKLTLFQVAVGETPQDLVCLTPIDTSAIKPNMGNGQVQVGRSDGENCVPLVRVDSLVSRCPDLVKVDVEGMEVSALKSLGLTTDKDCRPKGIMVEDKHGGEESVVAHLINLGYTCSFMTSDKDFYCKYS
jgi:FkbM family methyltransferase